MQLHELKSPRGSRKRRKIVGRGQGSGHGKTSCRGHNGQGQRPGRGTLLGSEGGQMPLIRRLPKVGFNSKSPTIYQIVNLESLSRVEEGTLIDAEYLRTRGLIKRLTKPFKILGTGEITKALTIKAHSFSKTAQEKITKAGGKAETIVKTSAEEAKA